MLSTQTVFLAQNKINAREMASRSLLRERIDCLSRKEEMNLLVRFRKELKSHQKKKDKDACGWTLLMMVLILRAQRQHDEISKLLEYAQIVFTASGNELGLACVSEELAYLNREFDRDALALEYAFQAMKAFEAMDRNVELAWLYDSLAIIYMNRFQRPESLSYANKSRALFLKYNSKNGFAWNACTLGMIHTDMGYFDQAHRFYEEAQTAFQEAGSIRGEAWALHGLAASKRGMQQFKQALDLFEEAGTLFQRSGLLDRWGWCQLNKAALHRAMGFDAQAEEANNHALRLFKSLRNGEAIGWGLFQQAQLQRDRGQLARSWQTFREASKVFNDVNQRFAVAWTENELGKTYLELDSLAQARECFKKAYGWAEQLHIGALKADVEKNMAAVYLAEGQLQKAISLMNESEKTAMTWENKEIVTELYLLRANYWLLLADATKANESLDAAALLIHSFQLGRLAPTMELLRADVLAAQNRFDEAAHCLQQTEQLSKRMRQRHARVKAIIGMVQLSLLTKSPADLSLMIFNAEKDIRAVGSRLTKAKGLILKTIVGWNASRSWNARSLSAGLQILDAAGLVTQEKKFLDVALFAAKQAGRKDEVERYQADLSHLLKDGPVDLHLIRQTREVLSTFPVFVAV